ncbi:MAG: nucleotidyltransferase domain-containing protein [Candidatus Omnitrophota bacterium]|nr:nucleotidyltransferase domain-containing protein [Candidatus Omnitrophota bacterium]
MEKEGILVSEYKANARYFKVNKGYPLYQELKSIVFKTVGVVGSLRESLKQIKNIKFSFIYGSYAKSAENYLSDIDLIVIGIIDEDALIKELDKMEKKIGREVNYRLYELKEFKKEIEKRNPFLLEILKDKKVMITGAENELRRISER